MAVGAENNAIGVVIGGKALHDLARRGVYDRKAITHVLRHVNELSVWRHRHARRIARTRAVSSLGLSQLECFGESRCATFPCVGEELIGVAAGDIKRAAVGRDGRTVECAILQQRLRHLLSTTTALSPLGAATTLSGILPSSTASPAGSRRTPVGRGDVRTRACAGAAPQSRAERANRLRQRKRMASSQWCTKLPFLVSMLHRQYSPNFHRDIIELRA